MKQKAHPKFSYNTVDEFIQNFTFRNGVHTIWLGNQQSLALLVQGEAFYTQSSNESLLVVFTAAQFDRTDKEPPFFSGVGLARSLELPLLAIADPTLSLSDTLPIAWYAGSQYCPNLPQKLSTLITHVSALTRLKLLIVGGSGAGFASLVQAMCLDEEATICVWNPQTDIMNYSQTYVDMYYETAFENHPLPDGHMHKVDTAGIKGEKRIVYLQNISDWHTQKHCLPFFKCFTLNKYGRSTFIDSAGKVAFHFGDWGKGHVVPPYLLLEALIKTLAQSHNAALASMFLESQGTKAQPYLFEKGKGLFPFRIETSLEDRVLSLQCSFLEGEEDPFQYAFYLMDGKERVDTKWYTAENHVRFTLPPKIRQIKVVVFVKDQLETVISKQFTIKG
ncbi:MAG TPA: hypothetical protein ENK86_04795 [Campylobacterales bacterium]|nr:hypothetical protein [Campylobacterales bacterium]